MVLLLEARFVSEASSMAQGLEMLVLSTALVQIEISGQLLEEFPCNFVQTFVVTRGWILLSLGIPWLLLQCHHPGFLFFFTEISWQLLDGLPWNIVQMFMGPRGWILMTSKGPSYFSSSTIIRSSCNLFSSLIYNQIAVPAKLMTFSSSSAVQMSACYMVTMINIILAKQAQSTTIP